MKPRNKLVLGTISFLGVLVTAMIAVTCITQAVYAFSCRDFVDAPIAASAENVYVTRPTNRSNVQSI